MEDEAKKAGKSWPQIIKMAKNVVSIFSIHAGEDLQSYASFKANKSKFSRLGSFEQFFNLPRSLTMDPRLT